MGCVPRRYVASVGIKLSSTAADYMSAERKAASTTSIRSAAEKSGPCVSYAAGIPNLDMCL